MEDVWAWARVLARQQRGADGLTAQPVQNLGSPVRGALQLGLASAGPTELVAHAAAAERKPRVGPEVS